MFEEIHVPDISSVRSGIMDSFQRSNIHALDMDVTYPKSKGIYAIYYRGDRCTLLDAYEAVRDTDIPLYVGSVSGNTRTARPSKSSLSNRMATHKRSLSQAFGDLKSFGCRCSIINDGLWPLLAEGILLQAFKPVWNCVIDGFGDHDPGKGRYAGEAPLWDTMHPGRQWASRLSPNSMPREDIEGLVRAHFGGEIPT